MKKKNILEVKNIVKRFSGVEVLKKVSFEMREGEVHALMGENGAGKSTLIKIITGVYPKDEGVIVIDGNEIEIHSRQDSIDQGISVIYQELSVIPTLTVMQNIFLGKELTKKGLLDKKQMRRKVEELIEKCDFDIRPDDYVESLSVAKCQMVEILKALLYDAKVIIMDEPTASLTDRESDKLFDIINRLRENGTSIIYISHRVEEVYRIADRLTVLRDGMVVGELGREEITHQRVVQMMIGKEVKEQADRANLPIQDGNVLSVQGLSRQGLWHDISFEAYGGQVLGIGGLVGSGRTELLRSIYGVDRYNSGRILFNGKPVSRSVKKNIRSGMGYIPEDRRGEGLIPLLSVSDNIAMPNYDMLSNKLAVVDKNRETKLGGDMIRDMDIRPANARTPVKNLSGGNQQKVVVGKWLARDLKVLLIDEPTVGVDIGVKGEIHQIFTDLSKQGIVVILVSSDLKELIQVSDRIIILHEGTVFREFSKEEATQEKILLAASGVREEEE